MEFNKGGNKPRGFGFGGFSMKPSGSVPRRTGPETQLAQMGWGMPGRYGTATGIGKRRAKDEEEYFDVDDEDHRIPDLEYQPAPGSPSGDKNSDSDGSDDPLDAFMADIEKKVKHQDNKKPNPKKEIEKDKRGVRDDIENEDEMESYLRYMKENPNAGVLNDDEDFIEYDEEGNAIMPERKVIDPLPPIDHDDIDYEKFNKNFYEEHSEIQHLSLPHIQELRSKLGIRVSGIMPPKPVSSFAHFGFDENLLKAVRKAGYTTPMPIQAQGVPIALSGRDIIGIAKTGSGKTAAFLWPLFVHIMDQKEITPGQGPIGLICAPTRELSQQIYQEAKKFGKVYNIKVVCCYGGGSMWEQIKACEEGPEIIVCTPGRLIDLVKKKSTNLRRVTYLIFDEADRMFDMGFEPQVRSIADHVRPDRQTLLFSATFRKRVERLARDILTDPIRVVQGDIGEANEDVTQIVKLMVPGPGKWQWLTSRLVEFTSTGSVLIFVTRKSNSEELASNLKAKDFHVGLMHGDMCQSERNEVIQAFKKKEMPVLVATDVAARGLDIPHIRTVINFDVARDIDTHTHRIGRTGRAGTKGMAYTLITAKDKDFAGHLVRNLEGANQDVPKELMELAQQNPWFKKTRFKQQRAKKMNVGGKGLGFRERPGLGAPEGSAARQSVSSGDGSYGSRGPRSDRIGTLKQAFVAQFKSNFVASASEEPEVDDERNTYTEPGAAPKGQTQFSQEPTGLGLSRSITHYQPSSMDLHPPRGLVGFVPATSAAAPQPQFNPGEEPSKKKRRSRWE